MINEVTIGLFILAVSLVYIYYKYIIFNFWHQNGVFYIKPVVPIGNLTDFVIGKMSIGVVFQNAYMKYKQHGIIGMYIFYKPNLVIADLDLIRVVLTKEFESFHDRGMFCNEKTDPLSANLLFLTGKKWENLRAKITPTFSSGKLKQMFMIVRECSEDLTECLGSIIQTVDAVEMKDIFSRYTTDIIMSTAFGIKSNCLIGGNNEFRHWGKKIFKTRDIWNVLSAFVPQVLDFFSLSSTDHGVSKFFMRLFRENVEYRKMHNIVRHDFINLLMQLMEKDNVDNEDITKISSNASNLTMLEATAQAFAFFAAGFETSAATATYCLYEIAQYQDIQDKVHQEIDETLRKHGELTFDAVNEMTYLHKVVQETLRKYPVVYVLHRICTKQVVLPTTNVRLPKGTSITIPVLGLHRDPSIYPNPDKFDPERFNADQVAARHPFAYLPFGKGPRTCIGARFAYMQIKVGIISVLSKFKVKLHPRTSVPPVFQKTVILLTTKEGIHFILEKR